jgi:hypothetical protein
LAGAASAGAADGISKTGQARSAGQAGPSSKTTTLQPLSHSPIKAARNVRQIIIMVYACFHYLWSSCQNDNDPVPIYVSLCRGFFEIAPLSGCRFATRPIA